MLNFKRLFATLPFLICIWLVERQLSFERSLVTALSLGVLVSIIAIWSSNWRSARTSGHLSSKSWVRAYLEVCSLLSVLYFSVWVGVWDGFYANFDFVRAILYCLTLGVFGSYVISRMLKLSFSRNHTTVLALAMSLVSSLHIIGSRVFISGFHQWATIGWMLVSIVVIHAALAYVLLKEFTPKFLVRLKSFRFGRGLWEAFAVSQIACFVLLAAFIDMNYPQLDRAKGVFSVAAPHLANYRQSVRTVSSLESESKEATFKVLNFNTWIVEGWIPSFIATPSKDVDERISLIPKAVAELQPDVVIFQEVWTHRRRAQLAESFKKLGYTYSIEGTNSPMSYFGIGNGLLIVSKKRLDPDIKSFTYSKATRIDETALFVRKGAIKTRVEYRPGQWIDVYATHMGASDTVVKAGKPVEFSREQLLVQESQAAELAQFIDSTRTSPNMILGSDLNTHPYAFLDGAYRENEFAPVYSKLTCAGKNIDRTSCLGLSDPVMLLPPEVRNQFYTYNTQTNYYAQQGYFNYEPPGRIDFIFNSGPDLVPVNSEKVITENPLSDHFGLLTTFKITSPSGL